MLLTRHPLPLLAVFLLTAPTAPAQTLVARLNCGGPAVTLANGEAWSADRAYGTPPSAGFEGGQAVEVASGHEGEFVGGYKEPHVKLHGDGREGWQAYRFDVAPGDYDVRLHLAELTLHGPTLRVFDILAEGAPLLSGVDLAAQLGVQYAGVFAARIAVADGRLDIEAAGADPAILSAIEVWTVPGAPAAPGPVTALAAQGSFGRNVLTWMPAASPEITGFRVYTADAPGGPFALLGSTWAAPGRWFDDAVPAGVSRSYRVTAVNAAGVEGPLGSTVTAAPLASAASALPVYTLAIDPADLAVLDAAVLIDTDLTVPAEFGFEGRTWDVQVRYRGITSLSHSKKSWKVKFPASDTFQGQTALNLKAHFADASLQREPLALDLSHAVGHPAPEREPVHLQVNGVYRGVFNRVEQVELEYLAARDRDLGGSVYQVDGDFKKLPDPALYPQFYEKKTNESTGHDDLVALIELVNDTPAAEFERAFAAVFDVDNLLSYYAMLCVIADEDSVRHNGYLLHDLALGRWEFITWDNESSLGAGTTGPGPALPIDFGTQAAGVPFNVLKSRVLEAPAFRWRYAEKLAAMLEGAAAPSALAAGIDAGHAAVAVDAGADVAKRGWESNALFVGAPAGLKSFTQARATFLLGELPGYQPAPPPTSVWINEFMADNSGTLADEAGQFEDWIELHNASGAPVDVGGAYLTDDPAAPTRWQFPAGTTIPALGHLLVWADDDSGDGPLHASFKLSSQGEALALFAADGATLLDVYHFRPQLPDVSEGRAPDGGPFLRLLATPTPGAANTDAGNLPPWVTWVEHAPALVLPDDEVLVTARATDADGVASVLLHVGLDGGPFAAQPMQPVGAERYEALLAAQPAGTLVQYWVEAVDVLGAVGAKPTHAPDETFSWIVGALQPAGVRISEFMADNATTLTDEAGDHEDWLELVNVTASVADLSGYHLSDSFANPLQWTIPAGTQLAPSGHLLVWADNEPAEGPLHAAFKLSKSGEAVALFQPDGLTLEDGITFGSQQTDVSFGRMPDAADVLVELLDSSPGSANEPADGGHARFDLGNLASGGPALAGLGVAQVGGTVQWQVSGASPSASGVVVIGVQTLVAPTAAKGTLLVQPLVLLPLAFDGAGEALVLLAVPGDTLLEHLVVDAQAWAAGARLGNAVATRLAP